MERGNAMLGRLPSEAVTTEQNNQRDQHDDYSEMESQSKSLQAQHALSRMGQPPSLLTDTFGMQPDSHLRQASLESVPSTQRLLAGHHK